MNEERRSTFISVSEKRCREGVSGLTPDGKKVKLGDGDRKAKWTPRSVALLATVVQNADSRDVHTTRGNTFWSEVAVKIGNRKSGDACRKFCVRKKLLQTSEPFFSSYTGLVNHVTGYSENVDRIDDYDLCTIQTGPLSVSHPITESLMQVKTDVIVQTDVTCHVSKE
jgi:hypothetical protein